MTTDQLIQAIAPSLSQSKQDGGRLILYYMPDREQFFAEVEHAALSAPIRITSSEHGALRYFTPDEIKEFLRSQIPSLLSAFGVKIITRTADECGYAEEG